MRRKRVSGWPRRAAVVERADAHPLLAQPRDIDVGEDQFGRVARTAEIRRAIAQLVDHRLAVPREIGRALARPGRRIGIGRERAQRLRARQQFALARLADDDVGGGQVGAGSTPPPARRVEDGGIGAQ